MGKWGALVDMGHTEDEHGEMGPLVEEVEVEMEMGVKGAYVERGN